MIAEQWHLFKANKGDYVLTLIRQAFQTIASVGRRALNRLYHVVTRIPVVGKIAAKLAGKKGTDRVDLLSESLNTIEHRLDIVEIKINQLLDRNSNRNLLPANQENETNPELAEISQDLALVKEAVKSLNLKPAGDHSIDDLYFEFENAFRGPSDLIKERHKVYLPYVEETGAGSAARPILDLGCGRGEWLELLKEKDKVGLGVDSNLRMVAECLRLGLNVIQEDVIQHVKKLESDSIGLITAFHLIEHLPFHILLEFFSDCLRIVRAGGVAVFETPNPENILVGANTFYIDPTHIKPLNPHAMRFWLMSLGWDDVRVLYLNSPEHGPVTASKQFKMIESIKMHFYSGQDYALIARKL